MSRNTNKNAIFSLFSMILCLTLLAMDTEAAPMPRYQSNGFYDNELQDIPSDILMELLSRFQQTMMRASNDLENSKRTVDFGLARGYSGTQEAKHRMGLAAANFPGGPGRRRRSETEV